MSDGGPTLGLFFESWLLFADAALAGAIAGTMLGFLGVYVVLRRMVFLSAALSNAAGLGVVLAFWVEIATGHEHESSGDLLISPTLGATLVTGACAVWLMRQRGRAGARNDGRLGVVYLVGAAGALALGTRIVQELHDVHEVLFGSAVAVAETDFWLLLGTALVVLGLHLWWIRGFLQASFDRDGARVRGLPVAMLDVALIATLSVAISVATRILGALPVFAFSVLPAMAAVSLVPNVTSALALAAVIGGACGFAGYVAAFLYELPVGPTQTLVAAAVVALATSVSGLRARL